MAIKNKSILKTYFQAGSRPTQQNFADLIDSFAHISNSSPNMFFPADPSLAQNDAGKLVVWKDGKAQLPEFEAAQPGTPGVVVFNMNLSTFFGFDAPYIDFYFNTMPSDGDAIGDFVFRTSPSLSKEVQIGSGYSDTIDNFVAVFMSHDGYSGAKSAIRSDSRILRITYSGDGRYGYNSWTEDVLSGYDVTGSFTSGGPAVVTATARLGYCLVPFLLLRGLGLLNGNMNDDYVSFYTETTAFTMGVKLYNNLDGTFPNDLEELKAGVVENLLKHESVAYAEFYNEDDLTVGFLDERPLSIEIAEEDERFWYDGFDGGVIIAHPSDPVLPHCNYPLLGLVKSVQNGQTEIHTRPVCTFKSSWGEAKEWTDMMSLDRVWILDSENPGYLRPMTSHEISSLEALFRIAIPGYVIALDKSVPAFGTFTGTFSTELFALQVLYMILQSSEDD